MTITWLCAGSDEVSPSGDIKEAGLVARKPDERSPQILKQNSAS